MRTRRAFFFDSETVRAGVGDDLRGVLFVAQLRDRHHVQDAVDVPVSKRVTAVADGVTGTFACGRHEGAVPGGSRANPPRVKRRTSLTSTSSSAAERSERPQSSGERRTDCFHEALELVVNCPVMCVESSDLRAAAREEQPAARTVGRSSHAEWVDGLQCP